MTDFPITEGAYKAMANNLEALKTELNKRITSYQEAYAAGYHDGAVAAQQSIKNWAEKHNLTLPKYPPPSKEKE